MKALKSLWLAAVSEKTVTRPELKRNDWISISYTNGLQFSEASSAYSANGRILDYHPNTNVNRMFSLFMALHIADDPVAAAGVGQLQARRAAHGAEHRPAAARFTGSVRSRWAVVAEMSA